MWGGDSFMGHSSFTQRNVRQWKFHKLGNKNILQESTNDEAVTIIFLRF